MEKFDRCFEKFPKEEHEKREKLCALMDKWRETISTKDNIIFPDDGKEYSPDEYFTADGFYPNYFNQKRKVLFLARETRYGDFFGYDDVIRNLKVFSENQKPGIFWRRILYIIYGIKHEGKEEYDYIPTASAIVKEMAKNNDYGFAIMNISKYSNDSDEGGSANFGMINRFLSDCDLEKRNFIREELAILDPDIIITMNLWDGKIDQEKLALVFPDDDFKEIARSENSDAALYDFNFNGKTIKLIDTYHFSSRKSPETSFYNPIMEVLFPNKK